MRHEKTITRDDGTRIRLVADGAYQWNNNAPQIDVYALVLHPEKAKEQLYTHNRLAVVRPHEIIKTQLELIAKLNA